MDINQQKGVHETVFMHALGLCPIAIGWLALVHPRLRVSLESP